MRIRFPDADDRKETKARTAKLKAIDAWWKALAAKVDDLDALFSGRGKKWDLPTFMHRKLGAVDERLMWEFGRPLGKKGLFRLVITPEDELALRPLTELVLARAPKLPGVELHGYRVPEPLEMLEDTLDARLQTVMPETSVVVTEGEHQTIDLLFLMKGCKGPRDSEARASAWIACETLLGEKVLVEDVGAIAVSKPKKVAGAVSLAKLRATVDKAVAKRDKHKPKKPCSARIKRAGWTLYKLDPEQQKDYPGQHDLFVSGTMWPELWQATHTAIPFYSSRFSAHGETFAYVKIDGAAGLDGTAYEDREDIEHAIDAVLGAKLGCVIGGGTGLRYSYVELALVDADRALPRIRQTLRDGKLGKRTWILFHDAELSDEWLGLYPSTPAPPQGA